MDSLIPWMATQPQIAKELRNKIAAVVSGKTPPYRWTPDMVAVQDQWMRAFVVPVLR